MAEKPLLVLVEPPLVSIESACFLAIAMERQRIAKFVEDMDDGPITTKAVKAYIAAAIRACG